LKTPGLDSIQVKGIVQVRSTLSGIVAHMQDYNGCIPLGCLEPKLVERMDDQVQYYFFRYERSFPYQDREFLIRAQFHQNPHTKEVLVNFDAAPDKLPLNDCCFRVTDLNNKWRLTPLENGLVEMEYTQKMNVGGFIPDLYLNMGRPRGMASVLSKMQSLLDKKKYQDAKFDFIKEK
jgi:hypothetical protein